MYQIIPGLSAIGYLWDNLMLEKNDAFKNIALPRYYNFGDWRLGTSKSGKGYIYLKKQNTTFCAINSW